VARPFRDRQQQSRQPDRIPFTPAAKKVLEMSLREPLNNGTRTVTPEHLLLALVGVTEGIATQILLSLDADPKTIREELLRLLPRPIPGGPPLPGPSSRDR
jgi:ATP-dependent Clp protease ATP-binding subunit ClpC